MHGRAPGRRGAHDRYKRFFSPDFTVSALLSPVLLHPSRSPSRCRPRANLHGHEDGTMSDKSGKSPLGKALLIVAIVGGGWAFSRHFEIDGLDQVQIQPRGSSTDPGPGTEGRSLFVASGEKPVDPQAASAALSRTQRIPSTLASTRLEVEPRATFSGSANTDLQRTGGNESNPRPLRLASWALSGFDRQKLAKPHVMDWIARVVRSVDLIAFQQITAQERDLLPRMIDHINRTGRKYDFVLGEVVGPLASHSSLPQTVLGEQYAFVFDTETIETDRGQLYTLADAGNQLSYDPLVGWFRSKSVPVEKAWTFTLVNFRVDSQRASSEVPLIAQIMAAVAADGRGEDDLLLCGMLQVDDRQLVQYLGGSACQPAVLATPTDIFGRHQLSNLISPTKTTTEYLGRGGVIDFPQYFNLTPPQAEELSAHLPVFGEFSPSEGF